MQIKVLFDEAKSKWRILLRENPLILDKRFYSSGGKFARDSPCNTSWRMYNCNCITCNTSWRMYCCNCIACCNSRGLLQHVICWKKVWAPSKLEPITRQILQRCFETGTIHETFCPKIYLVGTKSCISEDWRHATIKVRSKCAFTLRLVIPRLVTEAYGSV